MKKILLISILIFFTTSLFASEGKNEKKVQFGLFTTFHESRKIPLCLEVSFLALRNNTLDLYTYFKYSYFPSPTGSSSSKLFDSETKTEFGLGLDFNMRLFENTDIYYAFEFGYYDQWLSFVQNKSDINRVYNGLIIRPIIFLDLLSLLSRDVKLGFFYQQTFMNNYSDYNNFGLILRF